MTLFADSWTSREGITNQWRCFGGVLSGTRPEKAVPALVDSGSANSAGLARFSRNVWNLRYLKMRRELLLIILIHWTLERCRNSETMKTLLIEYVTMSPARWWIGLQLKSFSGSDQVTELCVLIPGVLVDVVVGVLVDTAHCTHVTAKNWRSWSWGQAPRIRAVGVSWRVEHWTADHFTPELQIWQQQMQRVGIVFQHDPRWTHGQTCAVIVQSCSHAVRLGEGTLICLCSASPLVWWEMVPWLPCRLAVVRRLCRGIVMNSAYLIPSRGFQSHFIHTLTCVVSLVFFGQWKKGRKESGQAKSAFVWSRASAYPKV